MRILNMSTFDSLEKLVTPRADARCGNLPDTLRRLGSPSTSVAILDDGAIEARCYSVLDEDVQTTFQACSLSKPICGLVVMKMIEQGTLHLGTTLPNCLDEDTLDLISSPSSRHILEHVTIRHLLSHTANFGVHSCNGYPSSPPTLDQVLKGEPPANTAPVQLCGIPGAAYNYSAGGMLVLQKVLEHVSGMSHAALAEALVFQPLGMTRSALRMSPPAGNHSSAHYNGVTPCERPYRYFPELAAAGLWTTPTDMMRAVRALQGSFDPSTKEPFLPLHLAREILTEVQAGMALTWRAPWQPGIAFGHTGDSEPGWTCMVFGFADLRSLHGQGSPCDLPRRSGICIMTNSRLGAKVYRKLAAAICYLKGWPLVADLKSPQQRFTPLVDESKTVDLRRIRPWLGAYTGDLKLSTNAAGEIHAHFNSLPGVLLQCAASPPYEENGLESQATLVLQDFDMWLELWRSTAEYEIELWSEDGDGNCSATRYYSLP